MSPDIPDAAFLGLELASYLFAETTPEVPDDFRGIRIAGPKRLTAGAALRVPVSAVARFGDEIAELPSPFWNSVAAVVVEVQSNRCWVGSLMDPYRVPLERPAPAAEPGAGEAAGAAAPPPAATEDDAIPEAAATGVSSRAAHVDLRELLELPDTPGSYEVHLTYGRWASNTVRIVVERPRE